MADGIPLVDFSKYALGVDAASVDHDHLSLIGEEICKAFTQIGFCYIYNHGIPQETIQDVFSVSKKFFKQPVTTKEKYKQISLETNIGWIAREKESLNPGSPAGDLKESYMFHPEAKPEIVPDDVVPNFKTTLGKLFEEIKELAHRVLDTMSFAMALPNKHFLRDHHRFIGDYSKNRSIMRPIHYPQVSEIKPGQVRCGEHTDYGSITFLFQDNVGGLEVKNSAGEYISATPVEGAVVVNIGDTMERWTADKMKATLHRVLIPEEEVKKKEARMSVAFFVHPDDDITMKCLDGSDKYEPITFRKYLDLKFSKIY